MKIPDALWQRPSYLKAAHGSGMQIPLLMPPSDRAEVIAQANAYVKQEHGREAAQWAYRHVKRRLLLEEAVFADETMTEVKYYTNGPLVEQFVITRRSDPVRSARWVRNLAGGYTRDERPTTHGPHIYTDPLPPVVERGLKLASEIGSQFDQMRVDTLTNGHEMYLGELTVYNQAGRLFLQGHIKDAPLNRSWDIRRSWFMTAKQPWPWSVYVKALHRALDRRDLRQAAKD